MSMARDNTGNRSDVPASASRYHASAPREHPQHRHSSFRLKRSPSSTTATSTSPAPTPAQRATHRRRGQNATPPSHWQTALFRATAPPVLFSILIAGLLVELRTRLATATPLPAPAPPPPLPGLTVTVVSVRAETAPQRALVWAERHWPGLWAIPVLCASALVALRAVICACVVVFDHFVEGHARGDAARVARVRVGRWEDGGSLSGSELLAEMFG